MALIERNLASKAGGFTVQKFTAIMNSAATSDVTVAEAPLDKSFVIVSQKISDISRSVSADLTTPTNVRLESVGYDASGSTKIVFYVVTSN